MRFAFLLANSRFLYERRISRIELDALILLSPRQRPHTSADDRALLSWEKNFTNVERLRLNIVKTAVRIECATITRVDFRMI